MPPKKSATKKEGNTTQTQTVRVIINNNDSDDDKPKKSLRKPPARSTNQGRIYGVRGGRGRLLPPYNAGGTVPGIPPQAGPVINVNTAPGGPPFDFRRPGSMNTVSMASAGPYSGGGGSEADYRPPSMNTVDMDGGSSIANSIPSSYFQARTTNRERTLEQMRQGFQQEMDDVESLGSAVAANAPPSEAAVNVQRAADWVRGEFDRILVPDPPIGDSPLTTPAQTPRPSEAGSVSVGAVPTRGDNKRGREDGWEEDLDGSIPPDVDPRTMQMVPVTRPAGAASTARPWRG